MFSSPRNNPQYKRLMGSKLDGPASPSRSTGMAIWLVIVLFLVSQVFAYDDFGYLFAVTGAGLLSFYSMFFGIYSILYVMRDVSRPQNDLVELTMLSNHQIVHGYWRSMFDRLLTDGAFVFMPPPFVYVLLNIISIIRFALTENEPEPMFIMLIAMLAVGQLGLFWFFSMFGLMLGLILRSRAWAISIFVFLSLILLGIWWIGMIEAVINYLDSIYRVNADFGEFSQALLNTNFLVYSGFVFAWLGSLVGARRLNKKL